MASFGLLFQHVVTVQVLNIISIYVGKSRFTNL